MQMTERRRSFKSLSQISRGKEDFKLKIPALICQLKLGYKVRIYCISP